MGLGSSSLKTIWLRTRLWLFSTPLTDERYYFRKNIHNLPFFPVGDVLIKPNFFCLQVEAKKAVPKDDQAAAKPPDGQAQMRTKKIFVGGLAPTVDEEALRKYFEQSGPVEDAIVMYDHDNKRPRGFGFVNFHSEESVDKVLNGGVMQTLHDKPIEIKRWVPESSSV